MKDPVTPWVLGLGSSHNGGACLLRGNEIVVAIQEERLVRTKRAEHPASNASLAVQYCLDYAGITSADLSGIGVCHIAESPTVDDVTLNEQLAVSANGTPVFSVSHHLGHAIGAFATSGFTESAVLVVDGNGSPWARLPAGELDCVVPAQRLRFDANDLAVCEIISIYAAGRAGVRCVEKHVAKRVDPRSTRLGPPPFFSVGRLFENVGMQVFGEPLDGPGKVMGLAPYGKPAIAVERFFDFVGGEFVFHDHVQKLFPHNDRWPARQEEYADLAASVQNALEHALMVLVKRARDVDASGRLCYVGGVALNSVANERIVREGGFDEVHIMPASEDSGTALGAAFHALWELQGENRPRRVGHDSMGRVYGPQEVDRAIDSTPGIQSRRCNDVAAAAAEMLNRGLVVGWFQGGAELGPRALGHRSILVDPRRGDAKDLLNVRVKFREGFRPYAPAILLESLGDWFDTPTPETESPFMLRVLPFKPEMRDRVPAVVHVDGTGRVQTVTAAGNPSFYSLIKAFETLAGVPIVLNTSFNIAGEPIVETPDDALRCFLFSQIDACIIEDRIVTKLESYQSPLDLRPVIKAHWMSVQRPIRNQRIAGTADGPCARGFFLSAARGRSMQLDRWAAREQFQHVQIVTKGRWGEIVHLVGEDVLEMLNCIDGQRSGHELLASCGWTDSPRVYLRLLQRLAAAGIIGFLGHSASDPKLPANA